MEQSIFTVFCCLSLKQTNEKKVIRKDGAALEPASRTGLNAESVGADAVKPGLIRCWSKRPNAKGRTSGT